MEKIEKYIRLEHLSCEEFDDKIFNEEELRYLRLAQKMPYKKVIQYLDFFEDFQNRIDDYLFIFGMSEYFNVSKEELITRLKYVEKIKAYFKEKSQKIVKEQKKMIKKMERI